MTKLFISTPESRNNLVVESDLYTAWYKLISLIGFPVNTQGQVVDSIEELEKNLQHTGIACFTAQSSNYRTNTVWYSLYK